MTEQYLTEIIGTLAIERDRRTTTRRRRKQLDRIINDLITVDHARRDVYKSKDLAYPVTTPRDPGQRTR